MKDNHRLLLSMLKEQKNSPAKYKPGPYWLKKSERAARELLKHSLDGFRSASNNATRSYGDVMQLDATKDYQGLKYYFGLLASNLFPFSKILNAQKMLTNTYAKKLIRIESDLLNNHERASYLLKKYEIGSGQLLGKPDRKSMIHGEVQSHHSIHMLDLLDRMIGSNDIKNCKSYLEIGGGFGANTYLMCKNFPHIKKYIYIDIAPNLYVGTQFLKANFGDAVRDYSCFIGQNQDISFSDDLQLEIYCLLPHQIENIVSKIDIFHNANSFVEMPIDVVQNYADIVNRLMAGEGKVLISSYDDFNIDSTFDPSKLPEIFNRSFKSVKHTLLLDKKKQFFYSSLD